MDILILNWKDIKHPQVGGAEIIAFEFAKRLVKEGHTVTFFSSNFSKGEKKEEIDGVTIIRRGNLYSVYLHAYFYYRQLTKKPDRVVEMINTICWQTWLYIPSHTRIAYLNQLAKEVWFYEFPKLIGLLGYLGERIEYLPYKETKFLCYSESTKNDLISYGVNKDRIRNFPLGLDHKRYKKGGSKSKIPFFIFVARLVKMKKADLCIRAIQHVLKTYPKTKLAIIGNGPEEDNLVTLVKKLNLTNNVIFINKDNFFFSTSVNDKKVSLMQQAWAILLPSVKEGWGMVVTEAAACGTPAIVSNVSGLRDSVVNGKTGMVLSKEPTEKELGNALMKLIDDNKLRNDLSSGAYEWSKNFDWDTSFTKFKKHILE